MTVVGVEHEMSDGKSPVRRVGRGGVAAFFVYGVGFALTYCSQLVIARFAGAETYGMYAYVFAWMVVLAYFSTLGFDVALLRFVPAYQAAGAWPLVRGVIQYAQRRSAAVSLSIIVIGICVTQGWVSSPELRRTLLVGFALVPLLALVRIRCSVVRAFGGVVMAVVPDRVVRDGTLIGLVALATVGMGWAVKAPTIMAATLISAALGVVCTGLIMRRRRPRAIDHVLPAYDAGAWRSAAIPLVILGAAEALLNRTGVILLGWFVDTKEAGIYSLAFNIALVATLPRIAVNTLFAPAISDLYARNDMRTMQILISKASSWTLWSGLCIAAVLFVLAAPLLAWFGADFDVGVQVLRILLVAQVMVASAGSQLYVMTMTGHERSAAVLLMSCTIVNAVGSAALIAKFGHTGAAIGTAASLVIWNVGMGLFLWRYLGLLPGVLANLRFFLGVVTRRKRVT
jgi:O-antigen/teichoic acid export membrane protein